MAKRRDRGTGRIYKPKYRSKDGTVKQGRHWWIQYYQNGQMHRENARTNSKESAQGILSRRLGDIQRGEFRRPKLDSILFDELAEDIRIDYRNKEQRSLDRLEQSLARLLAFFGQMRTSEIGSDNIRAYINLRKKGANEEGADEKLSTGASNATVNRELAALRRAFNLGREQEPPKVLWVPRIKMLPESEPRQGVLTEGQFHSILRELPGYLRPFVVTLYYTGMRLREALGLRWGEVDLLNRRIDLPRRRTKNKKGKLVKIDAVLYEWLKMQWQTREAKFPECEWVFFGSKGDRVRNPYRAWWAACKRAGVFVNDDNGENKRHPTFHDFRRTFATDMRRAGVSEGVIMQMAGWSTRAVFERYNIKDETDQASALLSRHRASENEQSLSNDGPQQAHAEQLTPV